MSKRSIAAALRGPRCWTRAGVAGVALLGGCVTTTYGVRVVNEAFAAIEQYYVAPVDQRGLVAACASAMDLSIEAGTDLGTSRQRINSFIERTEPKAGEQKRGSSSVDKCIGGLVATLDRSSVYVDEPGTARSPDAMAGVGLELGGVPEGVRVISRMPDSPALRADIRRGDLVSHVDGEALAGRPLGDAVELLRGQVGSEVTLTLRRPGASQAIDVTVQRAMIRVRSVWGQALEPGVVYIKLRHFARSTPHALAKLLTGLVGDAESASIVLDLRGNRGGLLSVVTPIASAFLAPGTRVFELAGREGVRERRTSDVPEEGSARGRGELYQGFPPSARRAPLVVLVDAGTVSGGEALVAALQDHGRAIVVGAHTHGDASVQTLYRLPGNRSLRLTTYTMLRPNGEPIDGKGITPDVEVASDEAAAVSADERERADLADPQVARAVELLTGRRERVRPPTLRGA